VPLPLAYNCDDCQVSCCDTLFIIADRWRIVAADAINACLPVDVCGEIDSFVAVDFEADDPLGDAISISITNIDLAGDTRSADTIMPLSIWRADLILRLLETGYPPTVVSQGDIIMGPDRSEVHLASMHSIGHMEAILRATAAGIKPPRVTMWRDYVAPGVIVAVAPQPMRPIPPQSGLVGWTMTMGVRVALGNG
jgi:hypothetical protein